MRERRTSIPTSTCRTCQYPVQPIVGAELNVDGHPAAFLARTQRGLLQNLAALVTMARVGQWDEWDKKVQGKRRGRPKVTWAQVAAHANGLARADRPRRRASSRRCFALGRRAKPNAVSRSLARCLPGRRLIYRSAAPPHRRPRSGARRRAHRARRAARVCRGSRRRIRGTSTSAAGSCTTCSPRCAMT